MQNNEKLALAKLLVNEVFMTLPIEDPPENEMALNEAESLITRVMLKLEIKKQKRMVTHGSI